MPFQLLSLPLDGPVNNSLQIGDTAYWVSTTTPGTTTNAFSVGALNNVIRIGEVMSFTSSSIGSTTTSVGMTRVDQPPLPPTVYLDQLMLTAPNNSVYVGMCVLGTDIVAGTTVIDVNSTNDIITLSQNAGTQITANQTFTFSPSTIDVYHNMAYTAPTGTTDFLMFAKDKRANTTSLLGYYAEVKFSNDSHEDIELFSVNSEIHGSSK